MNTTKLSNEVQRIFTIKFAFKRCFFVAKILLLTIFLLNNETTLVNAAPQACVLILRFATLNLRYRFLVLFALQKIHETILSITSNKMVTFIELI